jgi:hypothetical protein
MSEVAARAPLPAVGLEELDEPTQILRSPMTWPCRVLFVVTVACAGLAVAPRPVALATATEPPPAATEAPSPMWSWLLAMPMPAALIAGSAFLLKWKPEIRVIHSVDSRTRRDLLAARRGTENRERDED